jgi:DNA-binding MarR family transcriptional regulator
MNKANHEHIFHYLLHSATLVEEYLRNELLPLGLGHHQARVIVALNQMGEASQVELAREFGITAASMSTMTTRLEKAGYITRQQDPLAKKRNLISLTDKGILLLAEINNVWDGVDSHIKDKIGEKQLSSLAEGVLALRDGLGGKSPGKED